MNVCTTKTMLSDTVSIPGEGHARPTEPSSQMSSDV